MSRKGKLSLATLQGSVPVFAALGDETRLRLVARLSTTGPQSIANLTEGEAVTRQAITKHLRVLRGAGIARDLRRGRERLWELERRPLDEARRCLDIVSREWDAALGRLQAFVEKD
jgi:DNA-binding transcriptional ArsR family regulator